MNIKLYDIEPCSKILLPLQNKKGNLGDQVCTFNRIDGMYSNISTPDGSSVHLAAVAELVKAGDHYELASTDNKGAKV